ncbi:peptidoglycan DD-metalloendopeptidase family protein [candidate division WWE3 bacterium]|uniref:Peptidoglycan DD-metalloendopeptidase family protein n=1 Tax=candidate division WWE3 bacterium TaxID=2053526 RepID=A0A955RR81_UNCKA|nr:peptidoglycan DD-metalloendopeptidase family protein [candidate division WWE3 bacterium]
MNALNAARNNDGVIGVIVPIIVGVIIIGAAAIVFLTATKPRNVDTPTPTSTVKELIVDEVSPTPATDPEPTTPDVTNEADTPTPVPTTPPPTITPVPSVIEGPTSTPPSSTNTPVPTKTPTPTLTPTPTIDPTTPPVLKNLMINFAPYSSKTGLAGAFKFVASEDMVFLPFGVTVSGPSGPKVLGTFEYRTTPNATVLVAADGYVQSIKLNPTDPDYEILITPNADSYWQVWYDHVKNVAVKVGDYVTAGTTLGTAGVWSNTLSRTELMVRYSNWKTNETYTVCPFNIFDPSLKSTYTAKVTRHMSDWESFKGDTSIYNESSQIAPGCILSTFDE